MLKFRLPELAATMVFLKLTGLLPGLLVPSMTIPLPFTEPLTMLLVMVQLVNVADAS